MNNNQIKNNGEKNQVDNTITYLDSLPKVLEDIISDYIFQMEQHLKFKKIVNKIKEIEYICENNKSSVKIYNNKKIKTKTTQMLPYRGIGSPEDWTQYPFPVNILSINVINNQKRIIYSDLKHDHFHLKIPEKIYEMTLLEEEEMNIWLFEN